MTARGELPIATGSAADFIPPRPTLKTLRDAAMSCRGCTLWAGATQTVFGEGPRRARVMIVGETPGDQDAIVCLGATAAQALLGKSFRVTKSRGQKVSAPFVDAVFATVHPSSILRAPDSSARRQARAAFLADLREVARYLHSSEREVRTPTSRAD